MPNTKLTAHSRRAAYAVLIIALIGGTLFVRDYLGAFAIAIVGAIVFDPLHNWFLKRMPQWLATTLTVLVVLLGVVIPVLVILLLSANDLLQLYNQAAQSGWLSPDRLQSLASDVTSKLNTIPGLDVSADRLRDTLVNGVRQIGPVVVGYLIGLSGSFLTFFINAVVFVLAMAGLLNNKTFMVDLVRKISPFADEVDDEYFRTAKAMTVAMVKGTFLISLVVGALATLSLWIIGFGYLPFFFVLFTLLSFIPLGAGVVYIPIGIGLILLGQIWQGIFLLLTQVLILNNVDNVLRPIVAAKEAKLPLVLLLVSTFAGVSLFGMLGVIYGPVIMIILYTTISLYYRHHSQGIPLK